MRAVESFHSIEQKPIGWLLDSSLSTFLETERQGERNFNPGLLRGKEKAVFDILMSKSEFDITVKAFEVIANGTSHEGKQWGTNWSNGKTAAGYYAEYFYQTVAESVKVQEPMSVIITPIPQYDSFAKQKRKGAQNSYLFPSDVSDFEVNETIRNWEETCKNAKYNNQWYGFDVSKFGDIDEYESDVMFMNDPFEIPLGDEYDNEVKTDYKRDRNGQRFIK